MAKCTQCSAELKEGTGFCTVCGAPAPTTQAPPQPSARPSYQAPPVYTPPVSDVPPKGSKYALISAGGYIGIMLLMCIPLVGFILTFIWACGGCRKLQKRNLARAALIMTAVSLVLSLIVGFAARGLIKNVMLQTGITQIEQTVGDQNDLLGLIKGQRSADPKDANSELGELQGLLEQLEGLTGEDTGTDDLFGEIDKINEEASENSDGWPSDLPEFPSGSKNQVETYRTEFTGTTLDDTVAYIETLKAEGYTYQDFYDFGMSEADMMNFGGWWGYNGKWYISISHVDGVTTIDHVTELPDLSQLLGG